MSDRFIALLRGVNVGGRARVPMADLRELAEQLGFQEPHTYIQSGNLLFRAKGKPGDLEEELERGIRARFGVVTPVLVRPAAEWRRYLSRNPFPEESKATAKLVTIALSKQLPAEGAAEEIERRGRDGERAALAGGTLWVYYPQGIGRSKLTPAMLDRAAGSPVTTRNWSTVQKLGELLEAVESEGARST